MSAAPAVPEATRVAVRDGARETLARDSLAWFVRRLWPVLEPERPLLWGWHLDLICAELEAVQRGAVRELLICVPPGLGKSLIVSVLWPAFWWLHRPDLRLLALSSSDSVATRDSRRMRAIVRSAPYQRLIALQTRRGVPAWTLAADQAEKVNFQTTRHEEDGTVTQLGFRQCFAIGGSVTGERGDGYLVDDPHQVKDVLGSAAQVNARLDAAADVVDVTLPSRLNDQATGWRVMIAQRLHPRDMPGRMLARGVERAVILPAEHDPEARPYTGGGPAPEGPLRHPSDPRTLRGEGIHEGILPEAERGKLRVRLGARHFETQYNQRASAAAGSTFQRAWIKHYQPEPWRLQLDEVAISVDASFKNTTTSDFVSIQAWGRRKAEAFLLDRVLDRMTYGQSRDAIRRIVLAWPRVSVLLIEAKANGDALIDDLRKEFPFVVGYDPRVGKEARAQIAAVSFEAGSVWLPDPRHCPWIGEYVETLIGFPAVAHDDDVDATSQILLRWREDSTAETPLARAKRMAGAVGVR